MTVIIFSALAVFISFFGLIYQRASYNRDKIQDAEKMGALMQRVETMKEDIGKTNLIEAKLSTLSENVAKLTENVSNLSKQMDDIKRDIRELNDCRLK